MRSALRLLIAVAVLAACSPTNISADSPVNGTPDAGSGTTAPATRTLTVNSSGPGKVSGAGISGCRAQCTAAVTDGSAVTIVAVADDGAVFKGWTGACSGTNSCSFTVSGDAQVTATFAAVPPPPAGKHNLIVSKSGSGTITSSPAGIDCGSACSAQFDASAQVALSAAPDAGWTFSGWGGACTGVGPCTVSMGSDAAVIATFAGPPPPDECAGLLPAAPGTPLRARLGKGPTDTCRRGYADGSGNLALTIHDIATDPNVPHDNVHLFDASAKPLGTYAGLNASLDEQQLGFLISNVAARFGRPYLNQVGPDGRVTHEAQLSGNGPVELQDDPTGGVVIATFPGGGSPALVSLEAYDAQAAQRWRFAPPTSTIYLAHATDRAGNTLLLSRLDNQAQGQWFNTSGPVGPPFAINEPRATARLVPRIGSGFFLQIEDRPGHLAEWAGQFDALTTAMAPPPAWLHAYDGRKLHPAHGGTAYAFMDPAIASPNCTQQIEVVATTGKSCGKVSFNAGASGSCQTGSIDVAWDGTVIQQLSVSAEAFQSGSQTTCTWQWWTGYLR